MDSDVTLESIIAAQAATIEELQRAVTKAQEHVITVQHAFGDYYVVCSCGSISHPFRRAIGEWRCPRAVAEAEVAFHRARYTDRKRVMSER